MPSEAPRPASSNTNGSRAGRKSPSAFRTIGEASDELSVPQHVLRFWETKFTQLKPLKRAGGRRYYRPEDMALLTRIRDLLYQEGFTIKGARRHLQQKPGSPEAAPAEEEGEAAPEQPESEKQAQPDAVTETADSKDDAGPLFAKATPDVAPSSELRDTLRSLHAELVALRASLDRAGRK
ncbi:MAG: MerR family transcriptional regulator [Pseudomonadota bacterium]